MVRVLPFIFLVLIAGIVSCQKSPDSVTAPPASASSHTNQQIFQVKGVVVGLEPADREIKIRHEEIPGYMPAMTMPFEVKSTNELAGISTGDAVSFRMIVTDTDGWIDQIRKLGSVGTNAPVDAQTGQPIPDKLRIVRDVEPLNVGDPLPEYFFTNQFAQRVSTSQFKGQALAITFVFTRCPFPTFCPFTARNFAMAQRILSARTNGPANWHLLTISFDPEFDTPPHLKAFGETYGYDPKRWSLATGSIVDVMAIGEQFGLVFQTEQSGTISHNLRTAIVDASGRVQKVIVGNSWTGDDLVEEIVKAAAVNPKSEGVKEEQNPKSGQ